MADRSRNIGLFQGKNLGDCVLSPGTFKGVEAALAPFRTPGFCALNETEKHNQISLALLALIDSSEVSAFLLSSVLNYILHIQQLKCVDTYTFASFELWLNQHSGLDANENLIVRAKIMGKWLPRDEYQIFFPIGMEKTYAGSHFVTAHGSPDLDTTIASFWGWVDAFAARVSQGLHIWNVPGGAPVGQPEISLLFSQVFGENIFEHVSKTRTSLSVSSLDLITQKGVMKKDTSQSAMSIDLEKTGNAVILIDNAGFYLGDWRPFDMESVSHLNMLLSQSLRWFENRLHTQLISFFSKEHLTAAALPPFIRSVFGIHISDCEPVKELNQKQKKHFEDYLKKILNLENGLQNTFGDFAAAMQKFSMYEFQSLLDLLDSLATSSLFDSKGNFVEKRSQLFHSLQQIIEAIARAIQSVRMFVDRLGVALNIKTEVFQYPPHVISARSDLEEIRGKMGTYPYLTVAHEDQKGNLTPLGVVYASDLHKTTLGTVSLRDFCNREETKIPSYLEVISIIDHHKSSLQTFTPPTATISDAQSSNSLVAALTFEINDKYSRGGMTLDAIQTQMVGEISKDLSSPSVKRVMQRLLRRSLAAESSGAFFVDPHREFTEYLHFLYAILEDTDLLTKVSYRDIDVVVSLLNRLKSLMVGQEVEVIALDDLVRDSNFVKKAAQRILQNAEMFSLYRKVYLAKEQGVEDNLRLCIKGEPSTLFADTKEQNGCCRVGQAKMFAKNFPFFHKHATEMRTVWYQDALLCNKEKREVDLHLMMISTIAGAEDLFAGSTLNYSHKDELWIWIPETDQSIEHLKSFLSAFKMAPQLVSDGLEVEFLGDNAKLLDEIFDDSFSAIPRKAKLDKNVQLPIAVLRFKAGLINSRKAMISPYLPRLIS
jgi:hypothetical protein